MKKKFRDITVNSKKYGWRTKFDCDGDGHIWLKIWEHNPDENGSNKKMIFEAAIRSEEENSEWTWFRQQSYLTPKTVATVIEAIQLNKIDSIKKMFVYEYEYYKYC